MPLTPIVSAPAFVQLLACLVLYKKRLSSFFDVAEDCCGADPDPDPDPDPEPDPDPGPVCRVASSVLQQPAGNR